jgi:hypothetical protein
VNCICNRRGFVLGGWCRHLARRGAFSGRGLGIPPGVWWLWRGVLGVLGIVDSVDSLWITRTCVLRGSGCFGVGL